MESNKEHSELQPFAKQSVPMLPRSDLLLRLAYIPGMIFHVPFTLESKLLGLSKTNSTVAKVINAVPPSQESISQNGQGANRLGEVHAHKGTDARARDLKSVVKRGDGEVVVVQDKANVRQR